MTSEELLNRVTIDPENCGVFPAFEEREFMWQLF